MKLNTSANKAEQAARLVFKIAKHPERYNAVWLQAAALEVAGIQPLYPIWLQFIAWVAISAAADVVFYNGSWASIVTTMVCAVFSFIFSTVIPTVLPRLNFIGGFLGAFASSFIGKCALR